jgi:hypothetical protein
VVTEVARADAPHELERRESQIDAAENYVQCDDSREVQECGVIRLLEVVGSRSPDTNKRQEADRPSQYPSRARALAYRGSSFPVPRRRHHRQVSCGDVATLRPIPAAAG